MPRTGDRRARHRRAVQLAAGQGGVLARRQLYEMGVARWDVRLQVRAGRWRRLSDQTIALHNAELSDVGHRWAAVLQGGPRARLDAGASLVASGLERYEISRIRVSIPRGARVRRTPKYDIRQTRRWRREDLMPSGIPRTPPEVAAVHEALWARSDRQAQLALTMAVQQGLTTPERLGKRLLLIKRDRRRGLLHRTVLDLGGGIRSLYELDFIGGCRDRQIPLPDAQVLRRGSNGSLYLDFRWSRFGVVVEVDGIQHSWAENLVSDALRHNTIALSRDIVLRLPVMGMRVCPDEFYAQVQAALDLGRQPSDQDVIRPAP